MSREDDIKKQELFDLQTIMETEHGRRVVWRLLSYCGIYQDIEGESVSAWKQIGRRQVGLHLLAIVSDASEDNVFEMMKEVKRATIEEKIKNEQNTNDLKRDSESRRSTRVSLSDIIGAVGDTEPEL